MSKRKPKDPPRQFNDAAVNEYVAGLWATPGNRRKPENPLEFHETQPWVTRALARALPPLDEPAHPGPNVVLDLCTGRGAILAALPPGEWRGIGIDIDPSHREAFENRPTAYSPQFPRRQLRDFCTFDTRELLSAWPSPAEFGLPRFDHVVSNPPFSRAEEIIRRTLASKPAWGWTTASFLLPVGWLASKVRAEFHRTYPGFAGILESRPSFFTDQVEAGLRGATAMNDYMWLIYSPDTAGRWAVLSVEVGEGAELDAALGMGETPIAPAPVTDAPPACPCGVAGCPTGTECFGGSDY